jgi:uncharacterized protein with ParB-like and HNH nuclease domain
MAQFQDLTIKKVMEEINKTFFIPDMQREYVWLRNPNEKKIEQLFDSLLRGYPISSFLIWKLKKDDITTKTPQHEDAEKLNIAIYKFLEKYDERKIHNERIDVEQINSNDLYIVLDGQQRLTSLYIGLKGSRTLRKKRGWKNNPSSYEEKKLYVNLKHIPNSENPDDNYEFRFLDENESLQNENAHWFKTGDILDMDVNSVINYASKYNLGDKEIKILADLVTVFCIKPKISYFEETDKQLEKVLKIFIRVNSGGTQLSYSDLLMSILTANFSSNIRDTMNTLVDSLKEEGFGIMGRDQILKTCLVLTNSPHVFLLRNFNKNTINKIEENWNEIEKNIFSSIKLLSNFGYRNQLSSAYIITIISYFYSRNKIITKNDELEILKFVRNSQIKNYFTTSLDGKLETVANLLRNNNTFSEVNTKLLTINEDDINRLINLNYGNPVTFSVLQLLYPNLDYKNSKFHIDHIFPRSKFNNRNKALDGDFIERGNELFNLQLLEGEVNNLKRAKDPEVWMCDEYKTKDAIIEYKKRNYIKEDLLLEWSNISEFEEVRSNLLVEELKKKLL